MAMRPMGATVGSLASTREVLADSTRCEELDRWFRGHPYEQSAILGTPADDLTLINRAAFYQDLAGPFGFGWVLHQKRPVRLLDVTRGVVLDHAADARLAAVDLLRTGVSTDDDVLVVGGEHGPATIRASVLFAGLAQHHSEEADRLAALLHNLSDVILIVDPTGIITYSSSSLDKVVGSQASWVGRNCFEFLHPDDEVTVRQLLNTAGQQPGDTIRGEARAFGPTGSEPFRVFELAVTDQRAKTGIDGIILTWRDISERRALSVTRPSTIRSPASPTGRCSRIGSTMPWPVRTASHPSWR